MPKFTRIETVEAVQNTPESRDELLTLIRKAGQHPCVRDERGIEGSVSWWDGDFGNHVAVGEWVILDEVLTLHIRTDDEMVEEGYTEVLGGDKIPPPDGPAPGVLGVAMGTPGDD